jgi:hypothetical protein
MGRPNTYIIHTLNATKGRSHGGAHKWELDEESGLADHDVEEGLLDADELGTVSMKRSEGGQSGVELRRARR